MVLEDARADHQIVIYKMHRGAHIAVSCTCLSVGRHGHVPLASGAILEAARAIAAWQVHLAAMRETMTDDTADDARAPRAQLHPAASAT